MTKLKEETWDYHTRKREYPTLKKLITTMENSSTSKFHLQHRRKAKLKRARTELRYGRTGLIGAPTMRVFKIQILQMSSTISLIQATIILRVDSSLLNHLKPEGQST